MANLELVEGTPGLSTDEVAHVFLPGRGRSANGEGLSMESYDRVEHAAFLYHEWQLGARDGVIVPSGYKTPADTNGTKWVESETQEVFLGRPEADSMLDLLVFRGIGAAAIRPERHSFDTVTNFIYAERDDCFGDDRPAVIVAQEEHLDRMLRLIAPKTLKREYMGVVAPEVSTEDPDSRLAYLASWLSLAGLEAKSPKLEVKAPHRSQAIWQAVNFLSTVIS